MSPFSTLVERDDGDPAGLIQTTMPTESRDESGRVAPVDLSLRDSGGDVAPVNPLAPVRISKDASGGVTLERPRFGFRPSGTSTATVTNDRAFYPEVAADTDFVATPAPTGVEAAWQLRSADSPEELALDLDLPDGAQVREVRLPSGEQGAEVVRDGRRVGMVMPPFAFDADHVRAPATMRVVGDDLIVRVEHRAADMRYPIAVDPLFEDWLYWSSWTGTGNTDPGLTFDWWSAYSTRPDYMVPYANWVQSDGSGKGLYEYAAGAATNANYGDYVQWAFQAPGDSWIYAVDFGWAAHYPYWTYLYQGMASYQSGWQSGYAWTGPEHTVGFPSATGGASPSIDWNLRQNFQRLHCLQADCTPGNPAAGDRGNFALQRLLNTKTGYRDNISAEARLGGVGVWLQDDRAPALNVTSTAPGGWAEASEFQITGAATDGGLGMKSLSLATAGWEGPAAVSASCTGARAQRSPCPSSLSGPPWSIDTRTVRESDGSIREGTIPFAVTARDVVGNQATQNIEARIDRAEPEITTSGPLASDQDSDLTDSDYGLHVRADDGDAAERATQRSGVKEITILVDGEPKSSQSWDCARPEGSCTREVDWTFHSDDYQDGEHRITVRSTDQLEHEASRSWVVTVNRHGGLSVSASGPLRNLEDRHLNGQEAYQLYVRASKKITGVRRVALEMDGREIEYRDAPCTVGLVCPETFRTDILVGTTSIPEGKHTFQAKGQDPLPEPLTSRGQSLPWTVLVDRTPPAVPGGVFLAGFDESAGRATISWLGPNDPYLADGSYPSGVARVEVRFQQGQGEWSEWTPAPNGNLDIDRAVHGQVVGVQLRATDNVGNTSAVVSESVVVKRDDRALLGGKMTVIIEGPGEPQTYTWTPALPRGLHLELTDDGDVAAFDEYGENAGLVAKEWAEDDDARRVPVTYSVEGNQVKLTVAHSPSANRYPVVADTNVHEIAKKILDKLAEAFGTPRLNESEIEFCTENPILCSRFVGDARDAKSATLWLYEWGDADVYKEADHTKANAFLHAVRVALMTNSTPGNTGLAFEFVQRHERGQRGLATVMDRHNNEVAYEATAPDAPDQNNEYMCSEARTLVRQGKFSRHPPNWTQRQLIWTAPRDGSEGPRERADRDCRPFHGG